MDRRKRTTSSSKLNNFSILIIIRPRTNVSRVFSSTEERTTGIVSDEQINHSPPAPVESKGEPHQSITPTPPTDDDHQQQISNEIKAQPARKRRKPASTPKAIRPSIIPNHVKLEKATASQPSAVTSAAATTIRSPPLTTPSQPIKSNATTIFNLIRTLLEEKKSDQNDENLISTIDCLIDSLQHLRDRIQTLDNHPSHSAQEKISDSIGNNHDDSLPLNLTTPKVRHPTRRSSAHSDGTSPPATTVSSPSHSTQNLSFPSAAAAIAAAASLFPSQAMIYDKPFFPPFSGKDRPSFHIIIIIWMSFVIFIVLFSSFASTQHDTSAKLSQIIPIARSEWFNGKAVDSAFLSLLSFDGRI